MATTYQQGQAPWETGTSYPQGQAPWEQSTVQSSQPKSISSQIWDGVAGVGNALSKVLPGQEIGKAVGTSIYNLGATGKKLLSGDLKGAEQQASQGAAETNASFGKVAGDTISAVATPASLAIGGGTGATVLGRTANAALKYGATSAAMGGGNALAEGKPIDQATQAAAVSGGTGAALGGVGQLAGEGLNAILSKLPNRLVKQALPKITPGNEEYALKNTKVGSISSLLSDSKTSVSGLGQQVQSILKNPEYINDTGAGDFAIQKTLNAFPHSDYTVSQIVSTIKKLIPGETKLIDKVANGSATLLEKNTLRAAVDPIIKKVFTDAPEVSATKQIGAEFANALRGEVQAHAPETQPLFANLSKELDLRNALNAANKKLSTKSALGLYDIVAGLGGFATGGPIGTAAAIGAEKALRSPAVGLAAAKGISAVTPALQAGGQAVKNVGTSAAATALGQLVPQDQPKDILDPKLKQTLQQDVDLTGGAGAIEKVGLGVAGRAFAHIHPQDVRIMDRFIAAVAARKDLPASVEKSVQDLAEYWGINVNKSAQHIAQQFKDIIDGKLKVKGTIPQARDEVTQRFK